MALLPILRFPDPRLQKIARPVDKIDDSIRQLATDMAETMYEPPVSVSLQHRSMYICAWS